MFRFTISCDYAGSKKNKETEQAEKGEAEKAKQIGEPIIRSVISLVISTGGAFSYSELLAMELDEFMRLTQEIAIYYTAQNKGGGGNETPEQQTQRAMADLAIPNKRT